MFSKNTLMLISLLLVMFQSESSVAYFDGHTPEKVLIDLGNFDCRLSRFSITKDQNGSQKKKLSGSTDERFSQNLVLEAGNNPGQFYLRHQYFAREVSTRLYNYFGNVNLDFDALDIPFSFLVDKNAKDQSNITSFHTINSRKAIFGNEQIVSLASLRIEAQRISYKIIKSTHDPDMKSSEARSEEVVCNPARSIRINSIYRVLLR